MSAENPLNTKPKQEVVATANESSSRNEDSDIVMSSFKKEYQDRVNVLNEFYAKKSENLQKRMKGGISGVELDGLDKKLDDAIEHTREWIKDITENIRSRREFLKGSPKSGQEKESEAIPNTENQEVGNESDRSKKLNAGELFLDRIEGASDMRSLLKNLSELGDITAPDGYVYKKEDFIPTIGNLKDSNDPNLQRVTNTYGLRDKVRKLLVLRELEGK